MRALRSILKPAGGPGPDRLLRTTRIEQGCDSGWLEFAIVEQACGRRLARVTTRRARIELSVEQLKVLSMIAQDADRMIDQLRVDPSLHVSNDLVHDSFEQRETQRNRSATR